MCSLLTLGSSELYHRRKIVQALENPFQTTLTSIFSRNFAVPVRRHRSPKNLRERAARLVDGHASCQNKEGNAIQMGWKQIMPNNMLMHTQALLMPANDCILWVWPAWGTLSMPSGQPSRAWLAKSASSLWCDNLLSSGFHSLTFPMRSISMLIFCDFLSYTGCCDLVCPLPFCLTSWVVETWPSSPSIGPRQAAALIRKHFHWVRKSQAWNLGSQNWKNPNSSPPLGATKPPPNRHSNPGHCRKKMHSTNRPKMFQYHKSGSCITI